MFSITRNSPPDESPLRKIVLVLVAILLLGTVPSPAKAWYDAYGYWHPNHRHHYTDWRERERHYWRERERERERERYYWCARHPWSCSPYYEQIYRRW